MKRLIVSNVEKEVYLGGDRSNNDFFGQDEFRILHEGKLVSVANLSECIINWGGTSGPRPRALMVKGPLRDDDIDEVLAGLPPEPELTFQRANLEIAGVFKIRKYGSHISVRGVPDGELCPDQELPYDVVVDGEVMGRAVCYEPDSNRPCLYMEAEYSELARIMSAALAAGKTVTLSAVPPG